MTGLKEMPSKKFNLANYQSRSEMWMTNTNKQHASTRKKMKKDDNNEIDDYSSKSLSVISASESGRVSLSNDVGMPSQTLEWKRSDSRAAEVLLAGRFEEMLILELCQDGNRRYLSLSVRGLYKHVISCITRPREDKNTNANNINRGNGTYGKLDDDVTNEYVSPSHQKSPVMAPSTIFNKVDQQVFQQKFQQQKKLDGPEPEVDYLDTIPPVLQLEPMDSLISLNEDDDEFDSFDKPPKVPNATGFTRESGERPDKSWKKLNTPLRSSPKPVRRLGRNVSVSAPLTQEEDGNQFTQRIGSNNVTDYNATQPNKPQVTYRERLGGYIHPRDMRRLVTPFSTSNEPELIVRRHVMLLNFDPLRAIVLRDRLLVLVPNGADSLLNTLEERVRGGSSEVENSIFGHHQSSASDAATTERTKLGSDDENDNNATNNLLNNPPLSFPNGTGNSNTYGSITIDMHESDDALATSREGININGSALEGTLGLSTKRSVSFNDENQNKGNVDKVDVLLSSAKKKFGFGTRPNSFLNSVGSKNNSMRSLSDAENVKEVDGLDILKLEEDRDDNGSNAVDSAETISTHETNFNEWDEIEGKGWIVLPFELQCLDAVLYVVGSILSEETSELETAALSHTASLLHDSGGMTFDDPLVVIRSLKDAVRELTSRVKGFVQSMNRILDEDRDMALMNLSRLLSHPERFIQPVPQEILEEEADEPELILEANLQIALSLMNSLDLMKGRIDTASELIDQKLDALRNRLLFANMVISVFSLAVTSGAFVGSLFGMNLTNHYETDPNVFRKVSYGTIAGSFSLAVGVLVLLGLSGTMPRTSLRPSTMFKLKQY